MNTEHGGALIEDDGDGPAIYRRYRYVCRCGQAGAWRPSEQAARNDHTIHKHTALTGGGA